MKTPLRVVLVEDSEDDHLLIERELRRGGFEPVISRVETRAQFLSALDRADCDIILSDHALPDYDGLSALDDLRACGKDIPFILVSGTIGEALAVTAMKRGAKDFVLKDHLGRLPAAIERELGDARTRADRERMRAQLIISERMALAGTLAAGIAHEINNPLSVIVANLELIDELLAGARPATEDAAAIQRCLAEVEEPLRDSREATLRIRDIVRDVKLFAAPQDTPRRAVDVHQMIDSAIRMAWNEIRHRARLIKEYGEVTIVDANEGQLGQVVLNLVVNAAHAMPAGATARNVIRVVTRANGDHVIIEVRDTGEGIPRENLERIFDPFFTTKPVGTGTGLGLAICHRIVKESGGTIEVESEVGVGTTFRITLPAGAAGESAPLAIPASPATAPGVRRGRVLVVDDEPAILGVLQRSLGAHHEVVSVTSGREALQRIEAGERFDVILSDLMMPDVSGMELHAKLLVAAPDQATRMIFLTGGAFTSVAKAFLGTLSNPTIQKPFTIPNILAIIASQLP